MVYRLVEIIDGGLTRTRVGDYTAEEIVNALLLSTSRTTVLGATFAVELV